MAEQTTPADWGRLGYAEDFAVYLAAGRYSLPDSVTKHPEMRQPRRADGDSNEAARWLDLDKRDKAWRAEGVSIEECNIRLRELLDV